MKSQAFENFYILEKYLLFPASETAIKQEIRSFEQLLQEYLLEAIFKTEITRSSNAEDITSMLLTTTYGSILVAKMKQLPIKSLLKQNIKTALKSFM